MTAVIFAGKLSAAGRYHADTGTDPFVIAEIMGHSDLRITKRCCHTTDHRKRGAVERIAEYHAAENCLKIVTTGERAVG